MTGITITANTLKQKAFASINDELAILQKELTAAAEKGELKFTADCVSDAAKVFLTEKGFKLKVFLEPGKEIGISKKINIHWD